MPQTPSPQARSLPVSGTVVPSLGLLIPEILLPSPDVDLSRWAVVACDQHTSEPDYWRAVEDAVGDAPSTLRLVLPELFLETEPPEAVEARIGRIGDAMRDYLGDGTLRGLGTCAVLVERSTALHPSRWGLVLAVDLERYDWRPGSRALVRATEGTVLSRLPPRARIRRDAPLELPHVQVLFDDPGRTVLGPLRSLAEAGRLDPLYDVPLMLGGGRVRGFRVDGASDALRAALRAFSVLPSLAQDGLLFAVGDGNHSLASAKAHWDSVRAGIPEGVPTDGHPARYALVEAVDLHDPGLEFEPIHRLVYGASPEELRDLALTRFAAQAPSARAFDSAGRAVAFAEGCDPTALPIVLVGGGRGIVLTFGRPAAALTVALAQELADACAAPAGRRVDYIHGAEAALALAAREGAALLLPALPKASLFPRIAADGILPRKAFSMGEAFEKRYYLECRRIR